MVLQLSNIWYWDEVSNWARDHFFMHLIGSSIDLTRLSFLLINERKLFMAASKNSWVNVKSEWLAIFQETRSFVIIFLPSLSSPSSFFPHDLWKSFDGPGSLKCTWLMSFYRSCSRRSSRIRLLSNDWQSCSAGMMHPSVCILTKAIQLLWSP